MQELKEARDAFDALPTKGAQRRCLSTSLTYTQRCIRTDEFAVKRLS